MADLFKNMIILSILTAALIACFMKMLSDAYRDDKMTKKIMKECMSYADGIKLSLDDIGAAILENTITSLKEMHKEAIKIVNLDLDHEDRVECENKVTEAIHIMGSRSKRIQELSKQINREDLLEEIINIEEDLLKIVKKHKCS